MDGKTGRHYGVAHRAECHAVGGLFVALVDGWLRHGQRVAHRLLGRLHGRRGGGDQRQAYGGERLASPRWGSHTVAHRSHVWPQQCRRILVAAGCGRQHRHRPRPPGVAHISFVQHGALRGFDHGECRPIGDHRGRRHAVAFRLLLSTIGNDGALAPCRRGRRCTQRLRRDSTAFGGSLCRLGRSAGFGGQRCLAVGEPEG
mmetsp:Transcript_43229/g.125902  ORF Transcript_43229/g.125902 Transcript_43229/m.125902 type:complete len:201 (-) Transcript_43229:2799-3401(-)